MAIQIYLEPVEREAVIKMARQEMRPLREQIRWLIVQEAQRRGLLPAPPTDTDPTDTEPTGGSDDTATT